MRAARLTRALETGALALPEEGTILVLRPAAGDDLSALPKGRVRIATGFRPDHDAFAAAGYAVSAAPEGRHAAALVCLPRSREAARALVARAVAHLEPGGLLLVDGQKTDGIETMLRELRARTELAEPVARAHGKLLWCRPDPAAFAGWEERERRLPGGFVTRPGLFSADGPDPGSALLAAALPPRLPARVADLGAGWGFLAPAILARAGVEELHLIEAEAEALDCARAALADPRLFFHWADATRFRPARPFDAVVMNPPFHAGRAASPALGAAMIAAAAGMLAPGGQLWLVANRHLPYEGPLAAAFRLQEEVGGDAAFKILRACQPRAAEAARHRAAPARGGPAGAARPRSVLRRGR